MQGLLEASAQCAPRAGGQLQDRMKTAHMKAQTFQAETNHMGYITCLGAFTPSNIDLMNLRSCRSLTLIQVGLQWLAKEF